MGWIPVTDQRRTPGGDWVPVKNPMRGMRFSPMGDGTGYLAVRYDKARYIYEGVPQHSADSLKSTRMASSYLRQHIRDKCTFVEVKAYENLESYQADEGAIPEKKFARVQEIPDGTAEPQMSLFALMDLKKKRRGH